MESLKSPRHLPHKLTRCIQRQQVKPLSRHRPMHFLVWSRSPLDRSTTLRCYIHSNLSTIHLDILKHRLVLLRLPQRRQLLQLQLLFHIHRNLKSNNHNSSSIDLLINLSSVDPSNSSRMLTSHNRCFSINNMLQ